MDLFRAGLAGAVAVGHRAAGVVQVFHLPAFVDRLADGRVVAVLGHVADHGEGVDVALAQPVGQPGADEGTGQLLFHLVLVGPRGDHLVQLGLPAAAREQRRVRRCQVLHHDDRDARRVGGIHGGADAFQRRLDGGKFDTQVAADVFVLYVDDQQGAFGLTCGHGVSS